MRYLGVIMDEFKPTIRVAQTPESCGVCKFFRDTKCVFEPPQIFCTTTGDYLSKWPPVEATQWCGQFQLKSTAPLA